MYLDQNRAVVLDNVWTVVSGHDMQIHEDPLPLLWVVHPHHLLQGEGEKSLQR